MPPWIRYLVVFLGASTFIVGAPLLIWFVQGQNPFGDTSEPTGILVLRSEPRGAQVFVNSEERDETPSSVRFLKPGDYFVKLAKEGYFTWEKTLIVQANRVTWPWPQDQVLKLVRKNDPVLLALKNSATVPATWLSNNKLAAWSDQALHIITVNEKGQTELSSSAFDTPLKVSKIEKVNNTNFISLTTEKNIAIYSLEDATQKTTLPLGSKIIRGDNSTVVFLNSGSLQKLSIEEDIATTLADNFVDCTFFDLLYCIDHEGQVFLSSQNSWSPQLLGSFPIGTEDGGQLFLTSKKQLFLFDTKGNLWQFSTPNAKKIAERVINFWPQRPELESIIYDTAGELWIWKNDTSVLINRTAEFPSQAWLIGDKQWVGTFSSKQITATELPETSSQQHYNLSKADSILPSPDGKLIFGISEGRSFILGPMVD